MRKQYLSAPLPFVGQKRMYIKDFKEVLKQFPDDAVYVDLFGGSGLLSHITKWEKPDATVIYNDFDNYSQRLNNIGRTNALLAEIREIVGNFPRRERLSPEIREKILHLLDEEGKNGFMDYITLSTSLMFSMKYATDLDGLKKESFYNTVRQSNYVCDGYLDGLQVVSCDYKELVAKYRNIQNVVYLVDPPYLSTEVGTYRMRWRLSDYLDVLSVLVGSSYIYFTSDKSDILELCQWLGSPFAEAGQKSMHRTMNYSSSYTDIMLYKTVFNKAT